MKFRSYINGLAAALGIALSSPAGAQDSQEEREHCEYIVSPLPQNPFGQIPENPFCDEENLPDEEPRIAEYDPNANFPRWQQSAGMTYLRLELPNAVRLNVLNRRIEFSTFSMGTGDYEQLWRGNNLRLYFQPIDQNDIMFREGNLRFDLPHLLDAAQRDIPVIAQEMPDIFRDFWNDVHYALGSSTAGVIGDFAGFFRQILPQYTRDGVITPDEAQEIADLVEEHFEEVYERDLSPMEQQGIDAAIERFSERTNDLLGRLDIDDFIGTITADPNNNVLIGEYPGYPFRVYRGLLEDMLPVLHAEYGENSVHLWADAYARARVQSDVVNMYYFNTAHNEFIMRHGRFNEMTLVADGHLHLNAEYHAGRPLRDFITNTSTDVRIAIDQIELLLGYQPVMIDATMDARAWTSVSFENVIQDTYDVAIIWGERRGGFGVSNGFVHRFDLDFAAEASAWVNSVEYEIGSDARVDILLHEEKGRQVQIWHFIEQRGDNGFFGASLGAQWENLTVRGYSMHASFSLRSDFEGNLTTRFENEQHDELRAEQRVVPIVAGVSGAYLGPFTLFATARNTTIGMGIFAASDRGTIETRIDTEGHVRFSHLIALDGVINDGEARALHRDSLLHEYSLFPARGAAVWALENQYRASALRGLFLESGFDASFLGNPHEAPFVARAGIMFADNGYVRLGGFASYDLSVYGSYAGAGMSAFGLNVGLVQEQAAQRNSSTTSIVVQSRLHIDQFNLHLTAAVMMVSPALAEYLRYGENKFGYTGQISFETVLW